ncbi:MAG: helix-turn-helix transcriptional regulator [Ignavibacteria bacterium]|jgi:y4mF family transcriptional regulator|nr:helix-turn-helix transcriptional regulator [Ignavibacteria bacterium]MCU7522756.1 helix-turn-helix transcriptional regulator [Ignavibacteria bacterium]
MKKRNLISNFVREKRKKFHLTQVELAKKAGVGLRFVRDLEQGKKTLRMDRVNQVLELFGSELAPAKISNEETDD